MTAPAEAPAPRPRGTAAWRLAARLARRELRGAVAGGLRGFRIFLACLVVGVAAIAAVGTISSSVLTAINKDARAILGGDASVRIIHRPAEPRHLDAMASVADVAATMTMRAMARPDNGAAGLTASASALVELKAVADRYPLYGDMMLERAGAVDAAALQVLLGRRDGTWGVVVEPGLLLRLGLDIGDLLRVGEATLEIRDIIVREPDRVAGGAFTLGPRAMIAEAAMPATELVQPGSLITYAYKLRLPPGTDTAAWTDALDAAFPDAGWRIRTADDAAPRLRRIVDRVTMFLTFVGLTALLVGGVGIANAVRSFLDTKFAVIATLKTLGADKALVFRIYILQIAAIAAFGILAGLVVGAGLPLLVADTLAGMMPLPIDVGLHFRPLAVAAGFGALTALAFTIWPVAQAGDVAAASLFRSSAVPVRRPPAAVYVGATVAAVAALIGLVLLTADHRGFALSFVIGAAAALVVIQCCGLAVMAAAAQLPRPRAPSWRLAIANLHRPGAPTPSMVLSLGLGLSVLIAIAHIERNLDRQLAEEIPDAAPSFFFIDIQTDQLAAFTDIVTAHDGVTDVDEMPMLRGRIAAIDGVRATDAAVAPEAQWTLQGDRGVTWSATPVENSEIVAGEWWPPDYRGPTLISFDAETARGYGVGIGDTLTVNILGREVTGEIANLRRIDWGTLGINFLMVFSPGVLDGAPQTYLATVYAAPESELALQAKIVGRFANISAVRVRDAIETVGALVGRIVFAIRTSAATTVVAGILVLAGAIAAGQRRRIYDAVVLKVLGATRGRLLRTYAIEFGLIGLVTAVIACAVGTAVGWAVVTQILDLEWALRPWPALLTGAVGIVVTLALGFAGTYVALGQKAAPILRNE